MVGQFCTPACDYISTANVSSFAGTSPAIADCGAENNAGILREYCGGDSRELDFLRE